MILGSVQVDADAVVTHRDSYLLDSLSVISVRRPFFATGLTFGFGLAGFSLAFADLLYPVEIVTSLALAAFGPLVTGQIGQLKLLSRDLRGSELAGAVWGRHSSLNRIRRDIVEARLSRRRGAA